MADITMPQLGETVTEGTIIKWLKKVGDTVQIDEPLFEVSTDKVDSEVPSPVNGTITEILIQEGETADVGARLAVLGDAGGAPAPAPAEAAAPAAPPEPAPVAEAPAPPPPAPAPAPEPTPTYQAPPPPPPAPAPEPAPAAAPAAESGVATVVAVPSAPPAPNGTRGALLSPVVRRLIAEHAIDPANIPGTGLGGRITREDVLGYIDQKNTGTPSAPASAPAPSAPAAASAAPAAAPVSAPVFVPATPAPAPASAATGGPAMAAAPSPLGARDEILPFSTIRRVTADHMMRSIQTSAHTLAAIEADFENVDRVRRKFKEQFRAEEGFSLTYLPFVARAVIEVLHDYPHLNSSVGDNALIIHRNINLGFAVDLQKEGLIVPVIQNADAHSLRGIARSVSDLAGRARSRKLGADDISGGTFTITNPGPFGTFMTVPIIAQPQVAILSTDGVKRKPVVVTATDGTESIAIHSVGILALSFDHRAVDGAYAASFLRDVARVLETRDWTAEF